jgi:hypothetical protein
MSTVLQIYYSTVGISLIEVVGRRGEGGGRWVKCPEFATSPSISASIRLVAAVSTPFFPHIANRNASFPTHVNGTLPSALVDELFQTVCDYPCERNFLTGRRCVTRQKSKPPVQIETDIAKTATNFFSHLRSARPSRTAVHVKGKPHQFFGGNI